MSQYYTGDYRIGLNLFSLNQNLSTWLNGGAQGGAPAIDTMQAVRFAKEAGFDAVDITAYYIPGYAARTIPTKTQEEILDYVRKVKAYCGQLGLAISGTGVRNDFADPDDISRAADIAHVKYWIDVAVEMGAPIIRVFSGLVPSDIAETGWETIARERIAPALRECAEYGAKRGVVVGMQNHGDMAATADQSLRILRWADHSNLGIFNDIGSFQPFGAPDGLGYDWYADIDAVLPHTVSFQVKNKPAGPETDSSIDLARLFTLIRASNFRGVIPIESLWAHDEASHPAKLSQPPYDQIRHFLANVREAMANTKKVSSE